MIENSMTCRAIKLRILGLLQRLDYNEINATELSRLLSMVLTGACLYVRSFVLNYTALILLRCSCCCNQTENFAFDLNANDNALLWQMPWLKLKQEWIVLGWIYFRMYQIKLNQPTVASSHHHDIDNPKYIICTDLTNQSPPTVSYCHLRQPITILVMALVRVSCLLNS